MLTVSCCKRTLWAILLVWVLSGVATARGQGPESCGSGSAEVEAARFPEVSVTIRAAEGNRCLLTFDTEKLALSEDAQAVEAFTLSVEDEQEPLTLFLVIEQGLYATSRYRQDYDEATLRQLLGQVAAYIRDGVDTVAILTGRKDGSTNYIYQTHFVLEATKSAKEFQETIVSLDLSLANSDVDRNSIQPIETPDLLGDVFGQIETHPNPIIVYLASHIHAPYEAADSDRGMAAARRLGALASAKGIRIYVLQAAGRTSSESLQAPMMSLAQDTGGGYVNLRTDRDNMDAVVSALSTIRIAANIYTLTYRSSSSAAGERIVTVAPVDAPGEVIQASYQVALLEPAVEIVEPADGELLPFASIDDVAQVQITAEIEWPDGYPREIASVQVNGEEIEPPVIEGDRVQFELEIEGGATDNGAYPVTVQVQDEVGMISTDEIELTVEVLEEEPEKVEIPAPPEPPAVETGRGCDLRCWSLWLLPVAGVSALAAVVWAARKQILPEVRAGLSSRVRRITTILTGGGNRREVLATLEVLAGRQDLAGETIAIYADITTLGRDPELSDIQLYQENERSSISGRHCTIQHDQGVFWLIDNDSANGTAVNGRPLAPDEPCELKSGDEIVLGDKARRGARLHFLIMEEARKRHGVTVAESDWPETEQRRTGKDTQLDFTNGPEGQPKSIPLPSVKDTKDGDWLKKLE